MPRIASHLARDSYRPVCSWPAEATVQWGRRGVVLSQSATRPSYATAFFEAFPAEGGFFRGEGASLEQAERDAWGRYARTRGCAHVWGRRGFTNGLGTCLKCGMKKKVFRPVTRLGAWADPPSALDLQMVLSGGLRPMGDPRVDTPDSRHHARRTELRLRRAGVNLPPTPDTPGPDTGPFEHTADPYQDACRAAVAAWYRRHRATLEPAADGAMTGVFNALSRRILDDLLESTPPCP